MQSHTHDNIVTIWWSDFWSAGNNCGYQFAWKMASRFFSRFNLFALSLSLSLEMRRDGAIASNRRTRISISARSIETFANHFQSTKRSVFCPKVFAATHIRESLSHLFTDFLQQTLFSNSLQQLSLAILFNISSTSLFSNSPHRGPEVFFRRILITGWFNYQEFQFSWPLKTFSKTLFNFSQHFRTWNCPLVIARF